MNKIKKLLNPETISYVIFGGLTTVVNFVVFIPLHEFIHMDMFLANVIAWIAAVAFAYITNRIFVFNSKSRGFLAISKEILLFFSARLLSLGIEMIGLFLAGLISLNATIAKLLLAIFVVVINYVFSKVVIFKKTNVKHEMIQNGGENEEIKAD